MKDIKFSDPKKGKTVEYSYERFIVRDSRGKMCEINCAFDKDRFVIRGVKVADEEIMVFKRVKKIVITKGDGVTTQELGNNG